MSTAVHPPRPVAPRRGPLRRLLEVRGLVGGFHATHVHARLRAVDGVPLAGTYLPSRGGSTAVLLAHGFAANRRKPAYARLADGLATWLPVLSIDLRGHGESGGWSTVGDREALDVEAGAVWLRSMGHRVVALGLSMGGTAVLHAGARGLDLAGVVTISAPGRFRERAETDATRRLERIWASPGHRRALRLVTGVRLEGRDRWRRPPHPVEMAARLRAPLLVVHGHDDAYFPVADAQALARAAGGPSTLWLEPRGFGHAEDGLTPAFIEMLVDAITGSLQGDGFRERGRP